MEQLSYVAVDVAQEAEPGEVVTDGQELVRSGRAAMAHRGMVSAEWAVGIVAAIAIAGVLLAVVTNGAIEDRLLQVVLTVINTFTDFVN